MTFSVADHVQGGGKSFSFEFFPPKTDVGERNLWQTINDLHDLAPTFVSVTYGAGVFHPRPDHPGHLAGSRRRQTCSRSAPTCVGATRRSLGDVIDAYAEAGVHHILALRGDPPGDPGRSGRPTRVVWIMPMSLVTLVDSAATFTVGWRPSRGHPEASSLDDDAKVLRSKQESGADFAVTQFFFDPA